MGTKTALRYIILKTKLIVGERILNPMKQGAFVNRYSPYRDLKNPVRPRHATVEQLLAAGCHIGHNKSVCHPAMKPFIFGLHGDIHIINLDHTLSALRRACTIVREISFRRGIILVVGSRKGLKPLVVATAERMDGFVLSRPWIPGTITNASHVLFRGKVDAETIRFKQYWPLSERRRSKFEKLFDQRIMERMVYDRNVGQWVTSDEMVPEFRDWKGQFRGGSERKNSTESQRRNFRGSQRRHSRGSQRMNSRGSRRRISTTSGSEFQPNLAPLMAWEKFASMVQSISDFSADILYGPQTQLQSKIKELSVESVSNYIPDHGDNWYIRELKREREEVELRRMVEAENGDRNILEIHAMNKFLAEGKFRGKVRGRAIKSMKVELAGDTGHPEVKVFRDGSVMIGGRRFNAQGVPLRQYSDGSYEMHGQRYDIDGMRYDRGQEAFVFSDGSKLLLEGEPPDRKLMVVMGETMFDVTSTVVGSAQKREIIEKALDLELATKLSQPSNDLKETETEEGTLVEDHASVYLGGPSQDVRYNVKMPKRMSLLGEEGTDGQEGPTVTEEELVYMTADELVDIDDKMSALSLHGEIEEGLSRKRTRRNVESNMESPRTLVGNTSSPETVSPVRPDLIIFLNSRENTVAIREAASTHIPTIGIVDTDTDPQGLAYSIPGNDDSFRSLEYLAGVLSRAGEEGKIHRKQYLKQLDNLQSRAVAVMQGAWKDYDVLRQCERLERLKRNIKVMELKLKKSGRYGKLLEQFERNLKDLENFETVKAARRDIVEKYCRWYRFELDTVSLELIKKIISNHILLGQRELHRLDADTTGWSMEDFLAQVKTSTEMPGIPIGALENLALDQLTASRHAWAEARDEARSRALMSAKSPPQLEV